MAKYPVWTTKEGERIPINLMSESHLLNAYKMLMREIVRIQEAWLFYVHPFWQPRGEMARYYADQAMDEETKREFALRAWAARLRYEIRRRGLSVPETPEAKPPPEVEIVAQYKGATIARIVKD